VALLECRFMALHDIYEEDVSRTVSAFSIIVFVIIIITTTTNTTTTTSTTTTNTTQDLNHLNDTVFFFRTLPTL